MGVRERENVGIEGYIRYLYGNSIVMSRLDEGEFDRGDAWEMHARKALQPVPYTAFIYTRDETGRPTDFFVSLSLSFLHFRLARSALCSCHTTKTVDICKSIPVCIWLHTAPNYIHIQIFSVLSLYLSLSLLGWFLFCYNIFSLSLQSFLNAGHKGSPPASPGKSRLHPARPLTQQHTLQNWHLLLC